MQTHCPDTSSNVKRTGPAPSKLDKSNVSGQCNVLLVIYLCVQEKMQNGSMDQLLHALSEAIKLCLEGLSIGWDAVHRRISKGSIFISVPRDSFFSWWLLFFRLLEGHHSCCSAAMSSRDRVTPRMSSTVMVEVKLTIAICFTNASGSSLFCVFLVKLYVCY